MRATGARPAAERDARLQLVPVLVLLCMVSARGTSALTFELQPSYYAKCFSEEVPGDTPVYVDYVVAGQAGMMDVNFWVKNPDNKIVINKQMIDHGKHSFMTGPGDLQVYKFCFLHELYKKTFEEKATRMITMNLKVGKNAKYLVNPSNPVAKESDVDAMGKIIEKLEESLQTIARDLDATSARESLMEVEAKNVANRITLFSVCACLVIVTMGAYDFYYTKSFLKKKKFI